ncbi:hypothetical protein QTP88_021653 [Uroleucon formosanum]
MICTELHFVIQCFVVYTKFRDINEKLIQINDEQKYYNCNVQYSFFGSQMATPKCSDDTSPPCVIIYEKDFYSPKDKSFPLANTIELFRIKHWLSREAINDIKYLFGFQMGLSIIILAITINVKNQLRWHGYKILYSVVTIAVKTKKLITEMNNRHTDSNTKEELQLFYNQLSICSPEFTIFDILTINNSLITSRSLWCFSCIVADMVCTELHFAMQCFVVYTKFRDINEKLIQINDKQNYNNYTDKESPLANTIEFLRIKYWLTREAVNDIKGSFGFQMGLSDHFHCDIDIIRYIYGSILSEDIQYISYTRIGRISIQFAICWADATIFFEALYYRFHSTHCN